MKTQVAPGDLIVRGNGDGIYICREINNNRVLVFRLQRNEFFVKDSFSGNFYDYYVYDEKNEYWHTKSDMT